MTLSLEDFFDSYRNGNWSWCRDEFWGSNKTEMRDIMLEAILKLDGEEQYERFIRIIFLP